MECFPPNSVFIGVPESMAGRVLHCAAGKRCMMGMKFDIIFRNYQETFSEDCVFVEWSHLVDLFLKTCSFILLHSVLEDPKTLGQLALWLRNMPLSTLEEHGFFIMLVPGNTLYVPPGYIILEACMGKEGATIISYPTLLESQMKSWQQTWLDVKKLLNPNNNSQMSVCASMNILNRVIMLACVKEEADDDNAASGNAAKDASISKAAAKADGCFQSSSFHQCLCKCNCCAVCCLYISARQSSPPRIPNPRMQMHTARTRFPSHRCWSD